MPKDTSERHSAESLGHNAREIERLLTQLKSSIDLMQTEPGVLDSVMVPRERSRLDGITFLRSWTDAVRDAVSDAKHDVVRGANGVSDLPDTLPMRKKASKKSGTKRRSESAHPKASDTERPTGTD